MDVDCTQAETRVDELELLSHELHEYSVITAGLTERDIKLLQIPCS